MSTTPPTTAAHDESPTDHTEVACVISAIAPDEREAHLARASRLMFTAFQERHALPDGFAWRFTADDYDELCRFVANERRCCPFFTFTLEMTPHSGPIWLRITGDEVVSAFLQPEMASYVSTP
jgi:hypothetical protein